MPEPPDDEYDLAERIERLEDRAQYRYLSAEELQTFLEPGLDWVVADLGSDTGSFSDELTPSRRASTRWTSATECTMPTGRRVCPTTSNPCEPTRATSRSPPTRPTRSPGCSGRAAGCSSSTGRRRGPASASAGATPRTTSTWRRRRRGSSTRAFASA